MSDPQHKTLRIEVISADNPTVSHGRSPSGHGEDASQVNVDGKVVQIMVKKDGQSMFALHIKPDGSVVLSSYHAFFHLETERHLRLTNERPWE